MRITVITILIFLTSITTKSNAQAALDHSYRLKGGITLSNFGGQGFSGLRPGLQLGGSVKLGGAEDLFFKGELLFSMKGSGTEVGDLSRIYTLYYMEIPLMFGVNVSRSFSVNAGIQPAVLLGGTLNTSRGGNEDRRSIGNEIERFDYSLLLGVEYLYNKNWMFGVRFSNGFVPLQELHGILTRENNDNLMLNSTFQIYTSYSIDHWFNQ